MLLFKAAAYDAMECGQQNCSTTAYFYLEWNIHTMRSFKDNVEKVGE